MWSYLVVPELAPSWAAGVACSAPGNPSRGSHRHLGGNLDPGPSAYPRQSLTVVPHSYTARRHSEKHQCLGCTLYSIQRNTSHGVCQPPPAARILRIWMGWNQPNNRTRVARLPEHRRTAAALGRIGRDRPFRTISLTIGLLQIGAVGRLAHHFRCFKLPQTANPANNAAASQ